MPGQPGCVKCAERIEKTDDKGLAQLRAGLSRLRSPVILQWVPGYCGLVGNEWADKTAVESACSTDVSLPNLGGISFQLAKALIKREIVDPPTSHLRTKAVFDGPRNSDPLSRPDSVLIAQLRSGHCRKLAAYRSVVDANSSPTCPHCEVDPETPEHWIQKCPATAVKRIRVFGGRHPIYQSWFQTQGLFAHLVHVTPSCRRQQQQQQLRSIIRHLA